MAKDIRNKLLDSNLDFMRCGKLYTVMCNTAHETELTELQLTLKNNNIYFQLQNGHLCFVIDFKTYAIDNKNINLILKKNVTQTIYNNMCNMHTITKDNSYPIFDEIIYFINNVSINVSHRSIITTISLKNEKSNNYIEITNSSSTLKIHFEYYDDIIESLKQHPETIFIISFLSSYFPISIDNLGSFSLQLNSDTLKFQHTGTDKWRITNYSTSNECSTFELLKSYYHLVYNIQ